MALGAVFKTARSVLIPPTDVADADPRGGGHALPRPPMLAAKIARAIHGGADVKVHDVLFTDAAVQL
jgi:hypothetical protein